MLRRITAPASALALLSAAALSQSSIRSIDGASPGDAFGQSIARYVDIDGDGYIDLIVGSPGTLGVGRISIVSGKYIATGVGPAILWTVFAPVAGTRFGWSVANVGDVTGDGIADIAVGAPIPIGMPVPHSYLYLVSGSTHTIVATLSHLGVGERFAWSVGSAGDFDGDGINDIAVGNPFDSTGARVQIVSSSQWLAGAPNPVVFTFQPSGSSTQFGASFSHADLDGDGHDEWAIGAPTANFGGGAIYVFGGANHALLTVINGSGSELLGTSVDMTADVTNDGTIDLIAGAPDQNGAGTQRGEAIVFSGARILAAATPFDVRHWFGSVDGEHLGSSVASTPDMNGDLLHDVVVGSPDWTSTFAPGAGLMTIFSGLTGESMGSLAGLPGDHFGATVAQAWAYDANFGFEVAVGAPQSDVGNVDEGVMRIVTLFPSFPATYCTSKVNSLGCTPTISSSGSASKTSAASFSVKATNVLNNKNGLLFYGVMPSALPFQGGTLCVAAPVKRTSVQSTHGNAPPNDCSGSMSFDFNAYIQSGLDPALYQGRQVFAQYWSRDPSSASTTSLTNALRFLINP